MLGEGARTFTQAEDYFTSYLHAIHALGKTTSKDMPMFDKPSISIKLSALHPRYELTQAKRLIDEMLPKLEALVSQAAEYNLAVTIDAEETSRLDISLQLFEQLLQHPSLKGFGGIGLAVQAYQKRAWYVLDYLHSLAEQCSTRIPVRLVKGAYWDAEIKLAQQLGLPGYPVFTEKHHTDVSYLACAAFLLDRQHSFYPQFATHNAHTVSAILEYAEAKEFEFQKLHGMGEALHDMVLKENPHVKCRIYAPTGKHKELLPYLIRRMLENGSSTSFIHQLGDETISIRDLIEDPISYTKHQQAKPNPAIALPEAIYHSAPACFARKNSTGFDLGNLHQLSQLQNTLESFQSASWNTDTLKGESTTTYRPFDTASAVGQVVHANAEHIEQALTQASTAFKCWSLTSATYRASILEKAADLIEERRDEAIALCIHEAGKTLVDAIAEIREAADFCRYYAALSRMQFSDFALTGPTGESNIFSLHGRGIFLCISPWNFPMAIFTGQVTAALAAGNCVIAKPAGQTPLIAHFVVKLLHEAGIPNDVLHFMPASGALTGEKLVADTRISGIAFTGSTTTARNINQTLAAREGTIIPFIAETGGQNAMIVDSTALLEAAVDDIILSAFNSAGQRCSALRVLYVQDDIADAMITLLKGAMEALTIGNPAHISTHVGPVIDKPAQEKLLAHISHMHAVGKFIAKAEAPSSNGFFVAPHAFEIDSIKVLKEEVFGPVLHVIRFASHELDKVIADINSTGYGLTFGVHSRVEERINYLRQHIHAGNMYVNRNMIGAVVGVQPFGGEGLSGTGPKAGGAHYLLRFAHERTFTNNIAAIGGNITLLTQM
jgi:RHH-type proline utilization regulon transcriptional repressor/proline dehydrogenase/delta 1-pyrroline-5-carboxylate dehydrogenase